MLGMGLIHFDFHHVCGIRTLTVHVPVTPLAYKPLTGIFPPGKDSGFVKYAVNANLFRLESSILMRAKRATNRNNVATEKRSFKKTGNSR